jgi:PIN domain nuclease of toxin-antitoxin system
VRILLDTAALIFAVQSPERLSKRASTTITNPDNALEISSVSLVEIAIKTALRKIDLSAEILKQALAALDVRVMPYTAAHAFHLFALSAVHTDPFDRMLIAQALLEEVPVLTPDVKFSLYNGLEVIW